MNIREMRDYLAAHGVKDGVFYTIGGLGGGEIDGIEQVDGRWFTYFSERGNKRNYIERESESDACRYIVGLAEELARQFGAWKSK